MIEFRIKFIEEVLKNVTVRLADATCLRFGYGRRVNLRRDYDGLSAEELISQEGKRLVALTFNDWEGLQAEISEKIKSLKDDELGLNRFICNDILYPLQDALVLFYGDNNGEVTTEFESIISALYLDMPLSYPEELTNIHRREIEMEAMNSPGVSEDDKERELQRRREYTMQQFENRCDNSLYLLCLQLNLYFKRLACILEGSLLAIHSSKDLFAFQKQTSIVLYPCLKASEVAEEMDMPANYFKKLADRYEVLDNYTEFAGYGVYRDTPSTYGVDYTGIPEIDCLLDQTKYYPDEVYPEHHYYRNKIKFTERCKALFASNMTQEDKELKVFSIVHLLCHCYDSFCQDPERENLLTVVKVFLSSLEVCALKATKPICIKKMCMDLHYDNVLIGSKSNDGKSTKQKCNCRDFFAPWEELGLKSQLSQSLEFFEKRLCEDCARAGCQFRKAGEAEPKSLVRVVKKSNSKTDEIHVFLTATIKVCKYLQNHQPEIIRQEKKRKQWHWNGTSELYAYLGIAIKRHYGYKQAYWKSMLKVLHTVRSEDYIKVLGSKYNSALESNRQIDFPQGYIVINDAVATLK